MPNITSLPTLVLILALLLPLPASAKGDKGQAKIGVYVQILNQWSSYVFKNRSNYAAWVADYQTGPTCAERGIRGPSAVGDSAPGTYAGLLKALAKKPKMDGDAPAIEMVKLLQAMIAPTKAASDYYHKNEHKKDGCNKGQQLHPVLVAAWDKYAAADRKLRDFVSNYNDQREAAELAKTAKKYGKKLRWHFSMMISQGKALIRAFDTPKPDAATITPLLDAFKGTVAAAMVLVDKADKKDAQVLYQGGYKQYANHYAKQYIEAVQRALKALADPDPKRAPAIERAIKQVYGDYNRMVDHGNKVLLSKKIK